MEKYLHYNTMGIMHTGTVTIVVVSMCDVYHNFTSHVDKFEVYNSELILFNILSTS
jgi:hypothetical protein